MCLGCETIEEELAEQEQVAGQVKLRSIHEAAYRAEPDTADDEQQQ
jgi:hypothetical protein